VDQAEVQALFRKFATPFAGYVLVKANESIPLWHGDPPVAPKSHFIME
jgi:hypothetical protein